MTKLQTPKTFMYDENRVMFVADPQDIRACAVFFDENQACWCAGVSVKESYTKLRFADQEGARDFAGAVADAKDEYTALQIHNSAVKFAAKPVAAV